MLTKGDKLPSGCEFYYLLRKWLNPLFKKSVWIKKGVNTCDKTSLPASAAQQFLLIR